MAEFIHLHFTLLILSYETPKKAAQAKKLHKPTPAFHSLRWMPALYPKRCAQHNANTSGGIFGLVADNDFFSSQGSNLDKGKPTAQRKGLNIILHSNKAALRIFTAPITERVWSFSA